MNLLHILQQRFQTALAGLVDDPTPYVAMIKPAQDARFGDYQANCAMALGKALGKKPRDIAQDLVQRLPLDDVLDPPEIAGPGFINLRFRSDWLAKQVQELGRDPRLGVESPKTPRTFVIDFSSPNVAKPMHVGHLRSTIIGDALARLLRFQGHKVITDNHLGDWGTQFGILLYGYKNFLDEAALKADPVREMLRIYVHVRQLMSVRDDEDAEDAVNPVAEACRQETAKLHAGDAENVRLWQMMMPWCQAEIDTVYKRLDIHFDHTHGESFYNPQLPSVVADLEKRGIARNSEGAVVIFLKEGEPPALVRKRDGAFTYTTTDLATIRYRAETWQPQTVLYVVDFRQGLHFKNLFEIARRWGYQDVALEHVSFGSVLGNDRKPIKTREGGAIELSELLDEGVREAARRYELTRKERQERGEDVPALAAEELTQIYEAVGLGAVKYADLSQNRDSDYIFSWDKMLATEGNTATYMQYAYVRTRGIFRKGDEDVEPLRARPPLPSLESPHERALAIQLLRFPEALEAAATDYRPHVITGYLWDLAKTYSGFFQNCPVLKAESPALRQSRLLLCDLTARIIQKSLDLLGIRTVERM
ncbi:MAG: arginine--tRNA ligase [Gemmataceae bacterium]|nr:arginine--tRNA ligase [Gemmataceae bacterium]